MKMEEVAQAVHGNNSFTKVFAKSGPFPTYKMSAWSAKKAFFCSNAMALYVNENKIIDI